jgi:hypothetical protein
MVETVTTTGTMTAMDTAVETVTMTATTTVTTIGTTAVVAELANTAALLAGAGKSANGAWPASVTAANASVVAVESASSATTLTSSVTLTSPVSLNAGERVVDVACMLAAHGKIPRRKLKHH